MADQGKSTNTLGENYHFEFLVQGAWMRSPHLARPFAEAVQLVTRLNAIDDGVVYRYVPWDGQ